MAYEPEPQVNRTVTIAADVRSINIGQLLFTTGSSAAYVTQAIGYLITLLQATHLTPFNFLVFTLLQVLYSITIWWILHTSEQRWLPLKLGLLLVLTVLTGFLAVWGLQLDWLIYLVTTAILFMSLPTYLAGLLTGLLYLTIASTISYLNHWHWFSVFSDYLSLLPAFGFVSVFSIISRTLGLQRDEAERLLHQLEASNAELAQAHRQLREYANEVEELTIVKERTRVAREIHDTLGHYLSILNIQLETISKLHERDPGRMASEIAEARRVASQSMQEVRNAIAALRPTSIATLNLSEALTQLGDEFEKNTPDVQLTLDLETQLPIISPDMQVALYRAAQESLTNVRKHAQASKVLLRLRYEDEQLELMVLDNGKGEALADQPPTGGFGLIGLRERIELLGGAFTHGPAEPAGYRVTIRISISQVANPPVATDLQKAAK